MPLPKVYKLAIPTDINLPTLEKRSKTVVFYHDESTFNANNDQNLKWGVKGEKMIKPKCKGAGIMISDFIDEHQGFLALIEEEYYTVKQSNPAIKQYAHEILEYGGSHEGYWTRDNSLLKINGENNRLLKSNIPKHKGGDMFGSLIIAAATLLWVMTLLKSLT